ncbi:hypothetical protein [Marinactinospora rubrisoli]|uniref:Uncharacterized protein n=1 Tax=Marinactinospora rubrisoli TaxID=2715399 RepID=A0ABW2KNC1_9ACTN
MIHTEVFTIPARLSGLGYATPVLAVAADTAEETAGLPLITSAHRIDDEVMAYCHAAAVLGPIAVPRPWVEVVEGEYDRRAKIALLREPVPREVEAGDAELAAELGGRDVPAWAGRLVAGRLHAALRDVAVSAGRGVMDLMMDPTAPTTYPEWAEQILRET